MPGPTGPSLDHQWMPFTANRDFKARPRLLAAAEGVHYTTPDGRRVLDGSAGLWCVNAGHGRREIADAVSAQLRTLDYAPGFQFGHPRAFELAERVAALMPDGLDRVFFANSGSEAADSALKIARAYHRARGEPGRVRLVGRERAYHGVGFGGLSVGGLEPMRAPFAPLLAEVDHLPHTYDLARQAFARGQPEAGAERADALAEIVARRGAETIAAVIVEPVAGSTGVLPPPRGYLERLRALCDEHGILLVFDEVITAFGRLGAASAAERFGVAPDLLAIAKGLTNACVPMGAVAVRREIYETVTGRSAAPIELPHGYTYSGHPVACAAALATLDLYRDEKLFERARELEPAFEDLIHRFDRRPGVRDVRNIGLMGAVELEPALGEPGRTGAAVLQRLFERGVLTRVTGDTVAFSPPLVAERAHLETLMETLERALEDVRTT